MSAPLSSSAMRDEYASALCDTAMMVRVAFPGPSSTWDLLVESDTAPAWEAFADVMVREGYLFRESAGGTYNCRQIAGSDSYSLHAYGLALDLNPSKNPHGTDETDQPAPFRDAVKAIVTHSGRHVFAWGGDWSGDSSDPMHWQIGATRAEIATGIDDPGGDDMPLSDADKNWIRNTVAGEIDKALDALLETDDDETSRLSRGVWKHGGYFSGTGDDADDNAQRTLVRVDQNTRGV